MSSDPSKPLTVITGDSSGIGKALKEALLHRGHQVQGFSMSEGMDIREPSVFRKVVLAAKKSNLFINCAHVDYRQVDLLYHVSHSWRKNPVGRTLLNIGSVSGDGIWNYLHPYAIQKAALDKAVAQVQATYPEMRVLILRMGLVDTRMAAGHAGPKLAVSSAVGAALWMLDQPPDVFVQSLCLVPRGHGARDPNFPQRSRYHDLAPQSP